MPVYEYRCTQCGKAFERTETLAEHAAGPPPCPHCQGANVVRVYSTVQVKTSRKS